MVDSHKAVKGYNVISDLKKSQSTHGDPVGLIDPISASLNWK